MDFATDIDVQRPAQNQALVRYKGRIDNSWIAKDMKKYDGAVPLLEQNPNLLGKYPELLDRALDEFFRVDGLSKWEKQGKIAAMMAKEGGPRMLWDTVKAAWTMK